MSEQNNYKRTVVKKPKLKNNNNIIEKVEKEKENAPLDTHDFNEVITERDEVVNAFKFFDNNDKGFVSTREYFNLLLASRQFTEEEIVLILKESDLNLGDNMDYAKFYDFWNYQ